MVVIFAAGNDGPGNDTLNPYSVAPWVIGVAAGHKDRQTLADFSAGGRPAARSSSRRSPLPASISSQPAVTGVITALGLPSDVALGADAVCYTTMSGTSMATPQLAGVVALMLEAARGLSPAQMKSVLQSTPRPCPAMRATKSDRVT